MSPEDPAEEFVRHYLLLVPCQSFSDFQKLLELKVRLSMSSLEFETCADSRDCASLSLSLSLSQGVRRADQNHLLDVFLAKTSTASGLADTSFLTTLDMDPAAHTSLNSPSGSGLQSPTLPSHGGGLFGFGAASSVGGAGHGLPGLPGLGVGSSREGSRAGTPAAAGQGQGGPAFARLGARLGTRFFGSSTGQ